MRTTLEQDMETTQAWITAQPLHRSWSVDELRNCAVLRLEMSDDSFAGYFWMHFDANEPGVLMTHLAVVAALRGHIDYADMIRRACTLGVLMGAHEFRAAYMDESEAHAFHRIWRRYAPVTRHGSVLRLDLKDY